MTDTVLMTAGSGLFSPGPRWFCCNWPEDRAEELVWQCIPRYPGPSTSKNQTTKCALAYAALAGWKDWRSVRRFPEVFSRVSYDPDRDAPKFAPEDVYGLLSPEPGSSNMAE